MGMFDGLNGLERGISASWLRNQTILNNIANVDTPNFKSSGVEFEELYKKALRGEDTGFQHTRSRDTHMDIGDSVNLSNIGGTVVQRDATTYRMDGNNVDIDQEMTDFTKNAIWYNTLQRKINSQFNMLRTAIKG